MNKISFIGAGNMATSIIGGLIAQGYDASAITASDPNEAALEKLASDFGVNTLTDNLAACTQADTIVLAIKPQIMKTAAGALTPALSHGPLIISIAAGITTDQLRQWLATDIAIVRCMPNTPALVRQGACGLFATDKVTATQKQQAEQLLNAVGKSLWLECEALLDAVTAVSGSGPAYFFLLMEAMIQAGRDQGLDEGQARQLTLQTALGAAALANQSDVTVEELRRRVTSPGGTTEQAIISFENAGFQDSVSDAMTACAERARQMAAEFS